MKDLKEFTRLELNYRYINGTVIPLMENAGNAVADFVLGNYPDKKRILGICGKGNNGGDTLLAMEILKSKGKEVRAIFVDGEGSITSKEAKEALSRYTGEKKDLSGLDEGIRWTNLILDGLLGTGLSGRPKPQYETAISAINGSNKDIVSVDVPSGLGTGLQVKPHSTVCFTDLKPGMTENNSGKISVRSIGIGEECDTYSGPGDFVYLPIPEPNSHKGMNGVIGIVGGWEYYGSAVIASRSAMATGVDLVFLLTSEDKVGIVSSFTPNHIVRKYTTATLSSFMPRFTSMLVGSGMGRTNESFEALKYVLKNFNGPLVIDADGLNQLGSQPDLLRGRKTIITPHSHEFMELSGLEAGEANLKFFASEYSTVAVLKGPEDLITDGKEAWRTRGGNARMTMGGTGDSLAGVISALLSKGMGAAAAARLGSFVVKKAGEIAFESKRYWYSLDDLIASIPQVFLRYEIRK
jgi:NAD(P)H-hydrate epimerase